MDSPYAFLTEYATVQPGGTFNALGAGMRGLAVPELPGRAAFMVVAGFDFDSTDSGAEVVIEVTVVDADGRLVAPPTASIKSRLPEVPAGATASTASVTMLQVMFSDPGAHVVEFRRDGQLVQSVKFQVVQSGTAPAAPA